MASGRPVFTFITTGLTARSSWTRGSRFPASRHSKPTYGSSTGSTKRYTLGRRRQSPGQPTDLARPRRRHRRRGLAIDTPPRWRCLYFDAIASVFVPRHGESSATGYPDLDFARAHFAGMNERSAPDERQRVVAEATALLRLGTVLRKRGGDPWRWRIPVLLRASDLIREGPAGRVVNPAAWRTLGLIE